MTTGSGICISARFGSGALMNGPDGFNPPGVDSDESERMEAAGVVDAESSALNALENAQSAFPTAPTRSIGIIVSEANCYLCCRTDLLPRSPVRIPNRESRIANRKIGESEPSIPGCRGLVISDSFVLQRDHRIDARRAARGNQARQACHRQENRARPRRPPGRSRAGSRRTAWSSSAPRSTASTKPDGEPGERQRQAASAEGEQDVAGRRAQRHAHADFVGALRHRVGEHSVQSERREQQREQRERAQAAPCSATARTTGEPRCLRWFERA